MMTFLAKRKKLIGDIIVFIVVAAIFSLDIVTFSKLLATTKTLPYEGLFTYLEFKLQDRVYQKPTSASPDIVVIGIDEEALDKFGLTEQWSRRIMADAINILNSSEEYKPAVIAVDVLYVGEREDWEADESLVNAAKDGGNVVLAARSVTGDKQSPIDPTKTINVTTAFEKPFPALAQYTDYGIVNATFDNDGIVRSTRFEYPLDDQLLYSFPAEIYKKYAGIEDLNDLLGDVKETYISYYDAPGAFYQFSFADIFDEDFDPEYLADCIVMIGPYASGLMDSYYTAIKSSELMNGVEIHANVVQLLMNENFKTYVKPEINIAILLFVILLGLVLANLLDIKVLLAVFAAMAGAYLFLALYLFNNGHVLMLIYPFLTLIVIYIYQLIYSYILETIEKQKVKSAFKKYVDPKLVDKLMESGEANSDAVGLKKNIAVLFVDVRGFTPMSEALKDQPELVVKILNEYLELTSNSIFNNGGSVDKFIGDATMALFNGFVPLDDYVFKAVKAAWDIVQGAKDVNASIKEKYGVDVGFGVGVNCGDAIVGNLGPSFRKDYTAIGDAVNTAARLESNAKRSEVLISRNVYDIVKDRIEATSVGEIPLKGKSIKLEVFSVTGIL